MSFRLRFVASALLVGMAIPELAKAQTELVGQWGGTPNAVAMRDQLAFVGIGSRVVVLDLSDPASPRRIGQSQPLRSFIGRVMLAGDRAYVAAQYYGIEILDISDPARPRRTGGVQVNNVIRPDDVRDIAVSGDLVFAAASETGLRIYDVSNPESPRELGSYDPGEPTVAVAAGDGFAYLSSWYGLHVLDVSDPRSPRLVGMLAAVPNRFAVVGKLAYVAEDGMGLSIIGLADPTQPVRLGSVELPYDYPFDLTVEGSHAFVADGQAGVQVCDVSDPYLPRLVGSYPLDGDIAATTHGVAVAQGVMCVAEWPNRLHVVNVSTLQSPVRVAIYDEIAHAMKCPLFGGRVFLGGYTPGIQTIDVTDPAKPTRLSTFAATRVATAEVDITYAYVAEHSDGLAIYDVTDPATPRFVSRFATTESAMQARRYDDLLYLANHRAGVAILDVHDAAAPSLVSVIPTERAMDVLLLGDVLYVADAREGLISIDVSNPAAPIRLATLPVRGQPHCLIQVGSYLYVGGAVNVVDVSDPANPVQVAYMQINCTVQRMVLVGDRVYLTSCRLRVLDVSDPAAPRWVGSYQPRGPWIDDLAVADGLVYLAAREGGLEIVHAADVVVGLADLAVLLSAYGSCGGTGGQHFNSYADLDDSGCIDFHDLVLLLASYGQ